MDGGTSFKSSIGCKLLAVIMLYAPYFVRSGLVYLLGVRGATFRVAGNLGYDWSSRGSSVVAGGAAVPGAYRLEFNTAVLPSYGPDERWRAFPLRCLSTVLDIKIT